MASSDAGAAPGPAGFEREMVIGQGDLRLAGHLTVPPGARGMVVFAHGSGSGRRSPRNRYVAATLNQAGLGTLLADLLTGDEESKRGNVFDVRLLAGRLTGVTRWLCSHPAARGLPVGYFGASTGAAAALWAAAAEPRVPIAAIVSRGGRPDLAGARLAAVRPPTLLIAGGNDQAVLELNRQARQRLTCENELAVVPGATHLFAEPGALEQVADLATAWFTRYLPPAAETRP